MERYVAVVRPLQARAGVTWVHVCRVLALTWGLAMLCSVPNTSLHGLQQLWVPCRGWVPDLAVCTLVRSRDAYSLVAQAPALLFFCLPMGALSLLYLRMGLLPCCGATGSSCAWPRPVPSADSGRWAGAERRHLRCCVSVTLQDGGQARRWVWGLGSQGLQRLCMV